MIKPRLFLCSGASVSAKDRRRKGKVVVELAALGPNQNVNIRIEDVAQVFVKHLSPRLIDLIEIASYVYTGDCATRRGEEWTEDHSIEAWSRDFHFVIPVRDASFWNEAEVKDLLGRTLSFLSDDKYKFDFVQLKQDRLAESYLEFRDDEEWPFYGVDRVLMFSGGLDSLAGATATAVAGGKLVLVSHRPVGTIDKRQRELFEQLEELYKTPMIHIPVWINKDKQFGREHTQRTRSFLYSALGTIVAESVKADGVRFFENGVVSLNLPVADEVLRARASRTTHPQALHLLSELYSKVLSRSLIIDNPFLFKTKAEVVSTIVECNGDKLIQYTSSCAHTGFFSSKTQWHCGTCSQCIDRRIAIIATGQESNDPETDYISDVFLGDRKEGYERNIAVNYVRHAAELDRKSEAEIDREFNAELSRAARFFPKRREVFEQFIALHKRHGSTTCSVIQQKLGINSGKLLSGELSNNSLLGLIAGQKHLTSSWKHLADRIAGILRVGVPVACQDNKPKNEPHLQQICDALLLTEETKLIREFPFMRWSASKTKPDWSSDEHGLWVELKYVRERKDILGITEAIAADITKYGDNGRRVLYVVYDPAHNVIDEPTFSAPILARPTMQVAFIH
jgi:7-cyano-7-deazaguanine synthase in queuosine biosynthesis